MTWGYNRADDALIGSPGFPRDNKPVVDQENLGSFSFRKEDDGGWYGRDEARCRCSIRAVVVRTRRLQQKREPVDHRAQGRPPCLAVAAVFRRRDAVAPLLPGCYLCYRCCCVVGL